MLDSTTSSISWFEGHMSLKKTSFPPFPTPMGSFSKSMSTCAIAVRSVCVSHKAIVQVEEETTWELYMAKIARKEEANFPNATAIEEEVLLPSDKTERTYPQFSRMPLQSLGGVHCADILVILLQNQQ